jgi:uracil-DNA glycosylase family 4
MAPSLDPQADCSHCPRLAAFRAANRQAHPDWHNGAVPAFGRLDAPLLIVGLAPGLKGANRTGRPFTGDYAGDLLFATLLETGLARGNYQANPKDGLELRGCRITNAVRCVPPENKPTTSEVAACGSFLKEEIKALTNLRIILSLGRVSHEAVLKALAVRAKDAPFAHGALHRLAGRPVLIDSYHCSRYNTQTGRLTPAMFRQVVGQAADLVAG